MKQQPTKSGSTRQLSRSLAGQRSPAAWAAPIRSYAAKRGFMPWIGTATAGALGLLSLSFALNPYPEVPIPLSQAAVEKFDLAHTFENIRYHVHAQLNQTPVVLTANESVSPQPPPYRRARATRTFVDWLTMADRLRNRGQYVRALDAYSRACEIKSDTVAVLLGSGESYLGLGEMGLAADAFRRALKLKPNSRRADNGLHQSLSLLEERTPGEDALLRSLEARKQRKFVRNNGTSTP